MITPKQVKPEAPKSCIQSYSSLQPYAKSFYKFVTYYMIDHNYNIDTWNIKKTSSKIYHVPEKETRSNVEGKRVCIGSLSSHI